MKQKLVGLILTLAPLLALSQNRIGFFGLSNKVSHTSSGQTSASTTTYGGGLLLERSKSGFKGWEFGVLYLPRSWSPDSNARFAILPAHYNYWLTPILGLGFGGYWGMGQGQIELNGLSRSYADSLHSKYDYGLSTSFKINLPFQVPAGTSLLLEARYQYGLANLSMTPTSDRRYSDLSFFLGFRIGSLGFNPEEKSKGGGRSRK